MKTKLRIIAAFACALVCAFSFAACGVNSPGVNSPGGDPINGNTPSGTQGGTETVKGESTLLGEPAKAEKVPYSELTKEEYKAFKNSVEAFAADFAEYSYSAYEKADNFTVSPISVYMALALAAECANGDTRQEILDALGVTHEQLTTHFSTLYQSLEVEHKDHEGETTGLLDITNSIWVNEGTPVKQPCLDDLSNDYFTYSYSADFANKNELANQAIRDFIKEQTRGLIDKNFQLSEETLFTLINTLYLKTAWGTEDLPFAKDTYNFTAKDGSVKKTWLLQGYYTDGRAEETDTYSTFYTRTYDGYKIKFILPKDGYTVDDVFTAENIAAVNSITDYDAFSGDGSVHYFTRVLFPEYKCSYDEDIIEILQDKFGIDLFFKSPEIYSPACDFSSLSYEPCYCSKVQHVTDLTVNKTGIEGAAVTVIGVDGTAAPVETVCADFIVNKAFGFIITDYQNTTLFSGVVNNI